MADELTIGELAEATHVATSALRYWEELGVLPTTTRVGGQRRYPISTVKVVGLILLLRDVGFTLSEIRTALGTDNWRELLERKLVEMDELIAQAQTARTAIAHGLACPNEDGIRSCPNLAAGVDAKLTGLSLREAHAH